MRATATHANLLSQTFENDQVSNRRANVAQGCRTTSASGIARPGPESDNSLKNRFTCLQQKPGMIATVHEPGDSMALHSLMTNAFTPGSTTRSFPQMDFSFTANTALTEK